MKVRPNADGLLDRFKAPLVAQGYTQTKGVDCSEVFSPAGRYSTIRSLLTLAKAYDHELHQTNVTTAVFNGSLDCEIYMTQPEGYADSERPDYVCKAKRAFMD